MTGRAGSGPVLQEAGRADTLLGDAVVAERLANLNLFRSADLAAVRREISVILAEHLRRNGEGRRVPAGSEFIFCQPRLMQFGSGRRARTPAEFVEILRDVDSDSIGYHLFAPKAAGGSAANDFAAWFKSRQFHGDRARRRPRAPAQMRRSVSAAVPYCSGHAVKTLATPASPPGEVPGSPRPCPFR